MNHKYNKILIIGGTGFVGEPLVDLLSKKKDISIQVLYSGLLPVNKLFSVHYHEMNLSKPIKISSVKLGLNDFDVAIVMTQPDIKIAKNIIKIFESAKNLKKIIFISTILVYPNSEKKLSEKTTPKPVTSYEKGKMVEEKLFAKYAQSRNVKFSIVRLANVYGNVKNRGIVSYIFKSILDKTLLTVNGDGHQKRDFIFIEDAVKFIKFLIFYGQNNLVERFNICTGQGYTIQDLIKITKKITKKKMDIKYGRSIKEKLTIVGDNRKILKVSRIRLSYSIIRGLKKTYLNYRHE